MTTLEDDIARVAALRGKTGLAQNYVQEARSIERRGRGASASEIRDLFAIPDGRERADIRVYDHLPPRSRRLLQDVPINASAEKYADLLDRMRDESCLISAVQDCLPAVVHDWVVKHYGLSHPSAAKVI